MKAVIQRATYGSVTVKNTKIAEIDDGYVILVGIMEDDSTEDVEKLVNKVVHLRVMQEQGNPNAKMDDSILDTQGKILLVSQFTLCADLSYGRRPSFHRAMPQKGAQKVFRQLVEEFEKAGAAVQTGQFGRYMDVTIHNDGPVTITIDTKEL